MKKQKHPKLFKTLVIQKDQATFFKSWVNKKKFYELDFDYTTQNLWKFNKKNG